MNATTACLTHRRARWAVGGLAAITGLVAPILIAGCVADSARRSSVTANSDQPASVADPNRPAKAATLHAMARILATQGRDGECERVLRQVIERDPAYLPAYSDLAELYLRHNRVDGAIQVLAAGLARSPQDPILLNNLGMCHLFKQDYAQALATFTRASTAAPGNPTYQANQAVALGMLGRYDEAAAIYQQVLDSPQQVRHNLTLLRVAHANARAADADQPGAATTVPVLVEPR